MRRLGRRISALRTTPTDPCPCQRSATVSLDAAGPIMPAFVRGRKGNSCKGPSLRGMVAQLEWSHILIEQPGTPFRYAKNLEEPPSMNDSELRVTFPPDPNPPSRSSLAPPGAGTPSATSRPASFSVSEKRRLLARPPVNTMLQNNSARSTGVIGAAACTHQHGGDGAIGCRQRQGRLRCMSPFFPDPTLTVDALKTTSRGRRRVLLFPISLEPLRLRSRKGVHQQRALIGACRCCSPCRSMPT